MNFTVSPKNIVLSVAVLCGMSGGSSFAGSRVQGGAVDNSQEAVFGQAKWIGPAANRLHFMPERLTVFAIDFDLKLEGKSSASFIYGADDPRLMSRNLNIHNLENRPWESYIKATFSSDGTIQLYRVGYSPKDVSSAPIATFKSDNLKADGSVNKIEIRSNLGHTDVLVNGVKAGYYGLNPIGNGGDYIAFPALCGFGAEIPADSHAEISDITIRNFRSPGNVLFHQPGAVVGMVTVTQRSMPELRSSFIVNSHKTVKNAEMTVTARGIYDIMLNGKRVTYDYFNPAYTQYNKTHTYRTLDLTPMIRKGNNDIDVSLGQGWWSGPHTYMGEYWNFFGDRQSFIARTVINYTDGISDEYFTSPETWMVRTDGPLKGASFFNGEVYDATVSDGARHWTPASRIPVSGTVASLPGGWDSTEFIPAGNDRIMPVDTLTAVGMSEPRPGVYVYDMGQNFAGVPYLLLNDLKPGTEVSLRYGEVLYPDMPQYHPNTGMVMTENLRAAMNHDVYRARGGSEVFSPRFTLHGFRYIEVTGIDAPLPLESVKALPLSSINGFKAGFECSNPEVNRLWNNIKWSTLSNFVSIPMDCSQRNERLGWMGDISVYSPSAVKLADLSDVLRRYLRSVRDCAHPDGRFPDVAPTAVGFGGLLWGIAGITVPWEHYLQYGDKDVLVEMYPAMQRYVDYLLSTLEPETGLIVQNRAWGDLGDWLSPVYNRDDKSLLWECYLIHGLDIMAQVADILEDVDGKENYLALRDRRKQFFADTYIDATTGRTRFSGFDPRRKGAVVDTQSSYALPIAFGIVDDDRFVDNFINTVCRADSTDSGIATPPYSLMTGFIGTAWISKALSKAGRPDIAYRLLTSGDYPSWLYPVRQGATTIWERLDSYTHRNGFGKNNSMNSFNHYSFGSVADWLITCSLGIQAHPGVDPGKVTIAPQPDPTGSLTYAKGYLDLPEGRVESGWKTDAKGHVSYDVTIPQGVSATFIPYGGRPRRLAPGHHTLKSKLQRNEQ